MNEKLEDKLNAFLTKLIDAAERGGEFVAHQFPAYVDQLMMWYAASSAILFTLGVALLAGTAYGVYRYVQLLRRAKYSPDAEEALPGVIFGAFFALLVGGVTVFANLDWLQILVAPDVWLVEYARHLVSS